MMLPGRIAWPLIFMKGSSGKGGGREEGGAKARGSYQLAPGPATPVRPFRRGLPEGPEGRCRGRRRRPRGPGRRPRRSEARREGTEGVSPCRTGGSPHHDKKKHKKNTVKP